MFGQKRNHHFISVLPVFAILLLILIQTKSIQSLKNFNHNNYFVHATTNNRHTMKLEDVVAGQVISINGTKFVRTADNSFVQTQPICHLRVWDYDYVGSAQTFTAPISGTYKIELWGAQGGDYEENTLTSYGHRGGYTSGEISLEKGTQFYVYVGEGLGCRNCAAFNATRTSSGGGNPGGGATDVRLVAGEWDSPEGLRSRLMVAGGGGSSQGGNWGGEAGGLTGYSSVRNGYTNTGGSQTAAGIYHRGTECGYGKFGASSSCGATGGGGYYGGAGANHSDGSGSGGSSYISGHTGCVAVTSASDQTPKSGCTTGTSDQSCSVHYSDKVFTNTVMIDGLGYAWTNTKGGMRVMPNPAGGTYASGNGHVGHGHARITLLANASGQNCYLPSCPAGTAYSGKFGDCKPLANFTQAVQITDYSYTGSSQTFTTPIDGTYQVELWGASGGRPFAGSENNNASYVSGKITTNNLTTLYVYVGQQGSIANTPSDITARFNGGGATTSLKRSSGSTGGGATDIRIVSGEWNNLNSLRSRIIVAGGGGGQRSSSSSTEHGGKAGGLSAYTYDVNSYQGRGGTQTHGGETAIKHSCGLSDGLEGTFGVGGNSGQNSSEVNSDGSLGSGPGGGGGGWYGGSGGGGICNGSGVFGGGGSSYISGHTGCVAVTSLSDTTPKSGCTTGTTDNSCSLSPTGKRFTNTVMIDGAGYAWTNVKGSLQAMPSPYGGTYSSGSGHSGDGYARITRLEVPSNDCGLHAYLTGTNTCACAAGYYANASGSTTTNLSGSCLYRKCGSNTTAAYAIACTCADDYYANNQGTTKVIAANMNCVTCAANTTYSQIAKRCLATTMQAFTPAMCDAFPTPTEATGYTTVGTLTDTRNNASYVIRKFSDGKCWMAQNLAYGNVSSGADFKTYSYTNKTASGVLGSGLYGVAASPGTGYEGYLYDWQAVMQRSDAYYGLAYSGPTGVQGICPSGWHVPTGGSSGELQALSDATGTNVAFFAGGNFCSSGSSCLAGIIYGDSGSLGYQGSDLDVWSSAPYSTTDTNYSYLLCANSGKVTPAYSFYRYRGFSVRCVANY